MTHYLPAHHDAMSLAHVLERVLDKGLVIAGDIRVNLVDVELLTIKIRLLIASADKAREMGINWWEGDPWLSRSESDGSGRNGSQDDGLSRRIERLEASIARLQTAEPEPSGVGTGRGRSSLAARVHLGGKASDD